MSKGKSSDLLFNPDHQFTKKSRQKKVFKTIKNIFPEKKIKKKSKKKKLNRKRTALARNIHKSLLTKNKQVESYFR